MNTRTTSLRRGQLCPALGTLYLFLLAAGVGCQGNTGLSRDWEPAVTHASSPTEATEWQQTGYADPTHGPTDVGQSPQASVPWELGPQDVGRTDRTQPALTVDQSASPAPDAPPPSEMPVSTLPQRRSVHDEPVVRGQSPSDYPVGKRQTYQPAVDTIVR